MRASQHAAGAVLRSVGLRAALSALHHPRVARRTASAWRRRRELAALAGRALGR